MSWLYVVHDWAEHQGHIAAYKTRAQKAARARWSGSDASRIASSNAPSIVKHACSNAPAVPSLQRSSDPSLQRPPPGAAEGLDEPGEREPVGSAPPQLRVEPLSREAAAEESRRRQAVTQALTGQGVHPAKAALLAKRRSLTADVVFEHANLIATMPGINDPAAFLVRTLERAG